MKIITYSICLCLAFLAGLFFSQCEGPRVITGPPVYLRPDTLVQVRTQQIILPGDSIDVSQIIAEINAYRSEPGWIDLRENRIHAGLVDREWSIEYGTPRHSVGVYAGSLFGVSYHYRLGILHVGGIVTSEGIAGSIMMQF